MGGGGGRATITVPNYDAFNRQFDLQRSAIEQSMDSGTQLLQSQLTAAVRDQQSVLEASNQAKRQAAELTSAQAMRMAQLIGTPPPEKNAEAPVVGRNRTGAGAKGKSALRIEGKATVGAAPGTGLNIT
jgi:hypothetical protein